MRLGTIFFACLLFATSPAFAEPDAATMEQARAIGLEGLGLYDNGDYAGASGKLEQAWGMYHAPTLGLYSARALAKLGRLTEASARYLEAARLQLAPDAPQQFRQAQADAETERVALIQRIPRLRVEIAGTSEHPTTVTVDGNSVSSGDLVTGLPLNPGAHVVRGQRGAEQATMNVALQEGETRTVTLEFKQPSAPSAPPVPVSVPPLGTLDTGRARKDPGAGRRTVGWVVLGLGGVGMGVGAVMGLMASGKKSDLERVCWDLSHCPESARGDVDTYNSLRTASTIGFVAGGIGVAGGALLLLTAPKAAPERAARLSPWIGIGSAGMRGQF